MLHQRTHTLTAWIVDESCLPARTVTVRAPDLRASNLHSSHRCPPPSLPLLFSASPLIFTLVLCLPHAQTHRKRQGNIEGGVKLTTLHILCTTVLDRSQAFSSKNSNWRYGNNFSICVAGGGVKLYSHTKISLWGSKTEHEIEIEHYS